MPPDALTVLLASQQAEEIMTITKSLRSFYAGCRVEAVYSIEEAMEWADKQEWKIVLLDEGLLPDVSDVIRQVRDRAGQPGIIVMGLKQEGSRALEAMRQGADYYLIKSTPTFLTELPLQTRAVLEKRDLRTRLDFADYRYGRLIDTLNEVVYQLDTEGRFVSISSQIRSFLHYDPQDLIGQHYSMLVPVQEREHARWRFNERRSDARAEPVSFQRLVDKHQGERLIDVALTARSLYGVHGRFIGTIGIIRRALPPGREETVRKLGELHAPLNDFLSTARQLLDSIQQAAGPTGTSQSTEDARAPASVENHPPPALSPPHSFTERRQSRRFDIQIDVLAVLNGQSWEGASVNFSGSGLYLLLKGRPPLVTGQPVRLGFESDVGVLEISAHIIAVRGAAPDAPTEKSSVTGLALRFVSLDDVQSKILHSLLEGLRTQTVSVRLRILLLPQPASSDPGTPRALTQNTSASRGSDRRLSARITLSLDGTVVIGTSARSYAGSIVDLSVTGARLILEAPPDAGTHGDTLQFTTTTSFERAGSGPATPYRLAGDIVWASCPARSTMPEAPGGFSTRFLHLGIHIAQDAATQSSVQQILTRFLGSSDRMDMGQRVPAIVSERLECQTEQSRSIILYHDQPQTLHPGSPLLIVSPDYGQTKTDYLLLAYYFASNGFHVLRYDHTNHVGESDGGIVLTTLSAMGGDLRTIVRYAHRMWPASPIFTMATGVAARAALKALGHLPETKLLILFAPVLDVQLAVRTDQQEDLIAGVLEGRKQGVTNVFGFNIDADAWLRDAIEQGYADFSSTIRDVQRLRAPVLLFSAEQAPGIAPGQFRALKDALGHYVVDWKMDADAVRQIVEHPDRARRLFRGIVERARRWFYPLTRPDTLDPSSEDVQRQQRIERERLQLRHRLTKPEHVNFWQDYLDRSHYLINFSDYWHLLDHIYRLVGPLEQPCRVLDAGCGNGNFGTFLLIERSLREVTPAEAAPVHYVGLDMVLKGLDQAKENLIRVAAELKGKFAYSVARQHMMAAEFVCADLDRIIPFAPDTFGCIVCNLVLGYLHDPLFTLRELLRVLRPGGKIVITNFKPHADFSQLYHNFLSLPRTTSEVEQAKEILRASGHIIERAREGGFRYVDRQELAVLFMSSGASQPRIYSTFANQAYIVVAEKPHGATFQRSQTF